MESNKLGQEPAFPVELTVTPKNESWSECHRSGPYEAMMPGVSKRFYAACAAMQGICAASDVNNFDNEWISRTAYNLADWMLKQENL